MFLTFIKSDVLLFIWYKPLISFITIPSRLFFLTKLYSFIPLFKYTFDLIKKSVSWYFSNIFFLSISDKLVKSLFSYNISNAINITGLFILSFLIIFLFFNLLLFDILLNDGLLFSNITISPSKITFLLTIFFMFESSG